MNEIEIESVEKVLERVRARRKFLKLLGLGVAGGAALGFGAGRAIAVAPTQASLSNDFLSLVPRSSRPSATPEGGIWIKPVAGLYEPMIFDGTNDMPIRFPVFNVKDYGAKGDKIQDDTTFVLNAYAAAKAAGGGTVLFPFAIGYKMTSPLVIDASNIRIKGEGWKTVFSGAGTGPEPNRMTDITGSVIMQATAGIDAIQVSAMVTGVEIDGIAVTFAPAIAGINTGHGLVANNTSGTAAADEFATLINSHIGRMFVMFTSSTKFAFYLKNFQESTFDYLGASQCRGGIVKLEGTRGGIFNYGNSWFGHISGRGGYATGYAGAIIEIAANVSPGLAFCTFGRLQAQSAGHCANMLKITNVTNTCFAGVLLEGGVDAGDAVSISGSGGLQMTFEASSFAIGGTGTNKFTVTGGVGNIFSGPFVNSVIINDNSSNDLFIDGADAFQWAPDALNAAAILWTQAGFQNLPQFVATGSPATVSNAEVSTGIGVSGIKAGGWKCIRIKLSASMKKSDATGLRVGIWRSTVGVPALDVVPPGGDVVLWIEDFTITTANQILPLHREFYDSGLVVNTPYFYYVTFAAITGGTATIQNGQFMAHRTL